MGIDESYRRHGIGRDLKLSQREKALQEGIRVVHWTVDPLQLGNAFLNMNTLGGVAVQHYRNYYMFRNELNRVAASRIGVSWILDSPRVEKHSGGYKARFDYNRIVSDSATEIVTPVVVEGSNMVMFSSESWQPEGDIVLLEVPTNWNELQRDNIQAAEAWRNTSDNILGTLLSPHETTYAITGAVANDSKDRGFLVVEKITDNLGV